MQSSDAPTLSDDGKRIVLALSRAELEVQKRTVALGNASASQQEMMKSVADIRTLIAQMEELLRNLDRAAHESDTDREEKAALAEHATHRKEVDRLNQSLRQANLRYRLNADRRHIGDRKALLDGANVASIHQRRLRQNAIERSENITKSLYRVRQRMVEEVDHSQALLRTLDDGSKGLAQVADEYSLFAATVRMGRGIIKKLRRRENTDRVLIGLGFLFFLLVVAYITKRRAGALVAYAIPGVQAVWTMFSTVVRTAVQAVTAVMGLAGGTAKDDAHEL